MCRRPERHSQRGEKPPWKNNHRENDTFKYIHPRALWKHGSHYSPKKKAPCRAAEIATPGPKRPLQQSGTSQRKYHQMLCSSWTQIQAEWVRLTNGTAACHMSDCTCSGRFEVGAVGQSSTADALTHLTNNWPIPDQPSVLSGRWPRGLIRASDKNHMSVTVCHWKGGFTAWTVMMKWVVKGRWSSVW